MTDETTPSGVPANSFTTAVNADQVPVAEPEPETPPAEPAEPETETTATGVPANSFTTEVNADQNPA